MTTSKQHMEAVNCIAALSGTNEKLIQLSEAVDALGDTFLRVLLYTYDPFTTYGVKRVPECTSTGKRVFDSNTWAMLDKLVSRELSGNAALHSIAAELSRLEPGSQELLRRILQRDLQAGIAHTSINKVAKGLIPVSPYMRCALQSDTDLTQWEWKQGVYSQLKADGMFINVNRGADDLWLTTRSGQRLPLGRFATIADKVQGLNPLSQTHGELLVVNVKTGESLPRKKGNGVVNSVAQGGDWPSSHIPVLQVWDQIPIEAAQPKGKCITPYKKRYESLLCQLASIASNSVRMVDTEVVHSLEEAYAHYVEKLRAGLEGTIIKRPSLIWRDTGSSAEKGQVKLKMEATCELEIVDFVPGDPNGKHAGTFGSLLCASSCRKLQVAVSGLTDALRKEIHENRDEWLGGIITAVFNDIMYSSEGKPHSLFLPRFDERRYDRTAADSFERIEKQFKARVGVEEPKQEAVKRIGRTRPQR